MEMAIASLSMSMSMANTQDSLALGMLRKTLDAQEESMEILTDMFDSMPSPDGRGLLLDVRA